LLFFQRISRQAASYSPEIMARGRFRQHQNSQGLAVLMLLLLFLPRELSATCISD